MVAVPAGLPPGVAIHDAPVTIDGSTLIARASSPGSQRGTIPAPAAASVASGPNSEVLPAASVAVATTPRAPNGSGATVVCAVLPVPPAPVVSVALPRCSLPAPAQLVAA